MRSHTSTQFTSIATQPLRLFSKLVILTSLLMIVSAESRVDAGTLYLGKAFKYQGLLKQNGNPVSGDFDLIFVLYDQATDGSPVSGSIFESSYPITDGLLMIDLDFGGNQFAGYERWLEIRVRPAGAGVYETLAPRQLLTAVPYANGLTAPVSIKGNDDDIGVCLYAEVGANNQTALFGQASAGKGVWGQSGTGYGVFGVGGQVFPPSGSGVRGEMQWNGNVGELGSVNNGVSGVAGDSLSYGVTGTHSPTGNHGRLGADIAGASGFHQASGNFGYLATGTAGVHGVGASDSNGVYGVHGSTGAFGTLGSSYAAGEFTYGRGVYGYAGGSGTAAWFDAAGGGATAVFASAPHGKAIHAINAITGHAGYFEGYVYFSNRVGFGVESPSFPLHHSSGANLSFGGAWTNACDVNLKENLRPIDSTEILTKVADLPIQLWNYKAEDGVLHIGPTAQDFHAAFGLGSNDVTIGTVDADGVALAAIQALHAQVREKEEQIAALAIQNASLESRLSQLEAFVTSQTNHPKGHEQ